MNPTASLLIGGDDLSRCWWCGADPGYQAYHDHEWGLPVVDDQRLFEKICLEGFQAGLSWLTILRKRDNFRRAFADFDFTRVARFSNKRVEKLLLDAGIVRHRGKIESAINNAKQAVRMVEAHGSLAAFLWQFEPAKSPIIRRPQDIVPQTEASVKLSKELKRRGWTFIGPTTCYALMQAMGLVNDHLHGCHAWSRCETARASFPRPHDGSAGLKAAATPVANSTCARRANENASGEPPGRRRGRS